MLSTVCKAQRENEYCLFHTAMESISSTQVSFITLVLYPNILHSTPYITGQMPRYRSEISSALMPRPSTKGHTKSTRLHRQLQNSIPDGDRRPQAFFPAERADLSFNSACLSCCLAESGLGGVIDGVVLVSVSDCRCILHDAQHYFP